MSLNAENVDERLERFGWSVRVTDVKKAGPGAQQGQERRAGAVYASLFFRSELFNKYKLVGTAQR